MKNHIIFIFIITLLVSCKKSDSYTLKGNTMVNEIFNESEVKELEKIVECFDQVIWIDNKPIDSSYKGRLRKIEESLSLNELKGELGFNHSEKTKNLIKSLQESGVFNEIFYMSENYNSFNINIEGKYFQLLRLLSNDHDFIQDYLKKIEIVGGLSPLTSGGIITTWYKEVDFKDETIRLIWAIHYLSMTSEL